MIPNAVIGPQSRMREVLEQFPGAQRALFRRYHIGGCSSCAFHPEETLEQVCTRNGNLNVAEVLDHLQTSHEQDAQLLITPTQLAELLERNTTVWLVDVRSREEFEAVHLPGSALLTQDLMREIMAEGHPQRPMIIIDHQGRQALDAAAYFLGQGRQNVRCLRGGLDAWSQEIDPTLRRYELA
jgi:rhodanese-related sulfurtransferase